MRTQSIRAGARQPVQLTGIVRAEGYTIRHQYRAARVIATAAAGLVEIATADFGVMNFAAVCVFKFVQAAFGATVAQ